MNKAQFKDKFFSVFLKLYSEGKELFITTQAEHSNFPAVTFPAFETSKLPPFKKGWYDKLVDDLITDKNKETGIVLPDRFNKIVQQGNFFVSQPSGGFEVGIDKDTMIQQYKNALDRTGPVLMVITEPFTDAFLNDSGHYKIITNREPDPGQDSNTSTNTKEDCGLYYNDDFKASFEIEDIVDARFIPDVNVGGKVRVFKIIPNESKVPIVFANYHGDSKGQNKNQFKNLINWAEENGINYITGDSNITPGKSGISIGVLLDQYSNYTKVYSHRNIQKQRTIMDIFFNNQVDKGYVKDEKTGKPVADIDGMFIIKIIRPHANAVTVSNAVTASNATNAPTRGGSSSDVEQSTLIAFETPYSKETPILADHSVVEMVGDGITILSATGTAMDDAQQGIFGKEEWAKVNLPEFHKYVGIDYTYKWIDIYNSFANLFNSKFPSEFTSKLGTNIPMPLFDPKKYFPDFSYIPQQKPATSGGSRKPYRKVRSGRKTRPKNKSKPKKSKSKFTRKRKSKPHRFHTSKK